MIITSWMGCRVKIDLVAGRVKGIEEDRKNFSGFGVIDREAATRLDR